MVNSAWANAKNFITYLVLGKEICGQFFKTGLQTRDFHCMEGINNHDGISVILHDDRRCGISNCTHADNQKVEAVLCEVGQKRIATLHNEFDLQIPAHSSVEMNAVGLP